MAAILRSRLNFLMEAILEFEYVRKIAMGICDILIFLIAPIAQILTGLLQF